jgi:hypothetical protein
VSTPANPTPSTPQTPRSDPSATRRRAVAAGAVVLAVAVVVAVLAVAGVFDGGSDGSGSGRASSPSAPKSSDDVQLTVGPTTVQSPILYTTFPAGVSDPVMNALRSYVDDATVRPLRTGKADPGLANIVDAGVTAQLAGADRAVLVDEGLPAAVGRLTVTSPAVPLTALVGADGQPLIVVATVKLDVRATTKRGPVHIARAGDLEFAPGANGTWQLTGYDLTVNRDGGGVPDGATSASGTTTTKGRR